MRTSKEYYDRSRQQHYQTPTLPLSPNKNKLPCPEHFETVAGMNWKILQKGINKIKTCHKLEQKENTVKSAMTITMICLLILVKMWKSDIYLLGCEFKCIHKRSHGSWIISKEINIPVAHFQYCPLSTVSIIVTLLSHVQLCSTNTKWKIPKN